jgi:hypothetical protein
MKVMRFNESLNVNFKAVIEDCLLYISDETRTNIFIDDLNENSIITIYLNDEDDNDIMNLAKAKDKNIIILNLVIEAIDRLKEILTDFVISYKKSLYEIVIRISLKKEKFYFKKNNIIVLNTDKLLDMMSINKNSIDKVVINTDTTFSYLNIYFNTLYNAYESDWKKILNEESLDFKTLLYNLEIIKIDNEYIFIDIKSDPSNMKVIIKLHNMYYYTIK